MIVEAQAFLEGATHSRAFRFGFSTLALASALMMGCGDSSSTCKYTYSAWGACQSDGGQTHTVVSSTPSGCDGTPVLVQKCSSAAPDGAALYKSKCSGGGCHDALATSNLKGRNPTVETYLGAHTLSEYKLTSADLELILAAIGP